MRPIFTLFLTLALCGTFAGCTKKASSPSREELSGRFSAELPHHFALDFFEVDTAFNIGSNAKPVFKQRFRARIRLLCRTYISDLAAEQRYRDATLRFKERYGIDLKTGFVFLKELEQEDKTWNIEGLATSFRTEEGWSIGFEIDNDPVEATGKPMDVYQGTETVITGTSQEEEFFASVEAREAGEQEKYAARLLQEEEKQKAEEEIRRKAEEEARKKAEEESRRAEEALKRKADQEKRRAEALQREEDAKKAKERERALEKERELERASRQVVSSPENKPSPQNVRPSVSEARFYKTGHEPPLKAKATKIYLQQTDPGPETSLSISASLIEQERYGARHFFLRLSFLEPSAGPSRDIVFMVQHFISSGVSSASPYSKEIFVVKDVPMKKKIVVDTIGVSLSQAEGKSEYAGFIISVFDRGRLVCQKASRGELKSKGLTRLGDKFP